MRFLILVSVALVSLPTRGRAQDAADRLAAAMTQPGPFGLKMGTPKADLERAIGAIKETSFGVYTSPKVPSPHQQFESYILVLTPEHGLCKVVAVGTDIATSSFGDAMRTRFRQTKDPLITKYGKPNADYDQLKDGSIWDEPRDFMMGLKIGDRTLQAFWILKGRVDRVHAIELKAVSHGSDRGYISLSYEFENSSTCLTLIEKHRNAVF